MKTILVIDDEPDIVLMVELFLRFEGYHVVSAANGEAGLAAVQASSPDLVIVDWMMPVMDGVEFCQRLRRLPGFSATPVIMTTAAFDPIDIPGLWNVLLTKPVSLDVLVARIQTLLGGGTPRP